jgi:hypothetical protein
MGLPAVAVSVTEVAEVEVVRPQFVLIPVKLGGRVLLPVGTHHRYAPELAKPPVAV